jgi:hypothetical protein
MTFQISDKVIDLEPSANGVYQVPRHRPVRRFFARHWPSMAGAGLMVSGAALGQAAATIFHHCTELVGVGAGAGIGTVMADTLKEKVDDHRRKQEEGRHTEKIGDLHHAILSKRKWIEPGF